MSLLIYYCCFKKISGHTCVKSHVFKGHSHVNIYIWGILLTKTKELLDSTNIITIKFFKIKYMCCDIYLG